MNYNTKTEGRGGCLNTGYRKTVHPFRNFLVVLPPSPYTKLQLGQNNSGNMRPTLFVGWGEEQGMYELENVPEIQ